MLRFEKHRNRGSMDLVAVLGCSRSQSCFRHPVLSETMRPGCEDRGQRQMGSQLTALTAFWPCSFLNLPKGELRDVSSGMSDQLGGLGKSLNLSGLHFGLSPSE